MKLVLAIAFFATALIYSSVGFGGGSTYTALLVVAGVPFALIPVISLTCNVAVVSGNSVRFARAGLVRWRALAPLVVLSIPAAYVGGRLPVGEVVFVGLLALTLLVSGLRLLWTSASTEAEPQPVALGVLLALGAGIGLLSGVVGIGGGIFLAPALHALRWGRAREIAAACSVFILVNSVSGIAGQLQKLDAGRVAEAAAYWPLLLSVLAGGFLGNRLGVRVFSPATLKRVTAVLILLVAVRLAWRWASLASS